jgi:hypothetical protein
MAFWSTAYLILYWGTTLVCNLAACDGYPLRLLVTLAGYFSGVTAVNRDRLIIDIIGNRV